MFQVVVTDNPWAFDDKLTMSDVSRGAQANYPTLGERELIGLGRFIDYVSDGDAVTYAWVPSSLIRLGIEFVDACGFEVSGLTVWLKIAKLMAEVLDDPDILNNPRVLRKFIDMLKKEGGGLAFGMGHLFRQCHEVAIEGRRGRIVGKCLNKSQRSVHLAPNYRHSQKPEKLQDSLDLMFPGNKLEVFARRQRPGWTCLGNEIDGRDIRETLPALSGLPYRESDTQKNEEKRHE